MVYWIFKKPVSVCACLFMFVCMHLYSQENQVIPGGKNSTINDDRTLSPSKLKAFERNQNIGRGINIGNALEAPNEGEWGLYIEEKHIQAIADIGFRSVRLPVCWSAHTSNSAPCLIEPDFLNRVEEVINWCLNRDLAVIITIHHFNDLYSDPGNITCRNMFFAIWKQLSHYFLDVEYETFFSEIF